MKNLIRIVKRFISEDRKVLGRWNIDYCVKKVDYKVHLSNEDHCGPCGLYELDKKVPIVETEVKLKR